MHIFLKSYYWHNLEITQGWKLQCVHPQDSHIVFNLIYKKLQLSDPLQSNPRAE